jgi:hypothetical protein
MYVDAKRQVGTQRGDAAKRKGKLKDGTVTQEKADGMQRWRMASNFVGKRKSESRDATNATCHVHFFIL